MKVLTVVICSLLILEVLSSCKKNSGTVTMPPIVTDSFTAVVNNGYGSGKYKTGDTVHIFTNHYSNSQLFDKWGGDITLLNAPEEWHTWFVMPNKNVTVTGSLKSIAPVTLQLEQIRGRDRLKPVYSYFPTGHKGFVFLLHGSGGSALNTVSSYEFQQLIKDLVTDNFGVIITEAEEATTGIDIDGNGKLRWSDSPLDSITNIDYANIKIITDTFYRRGTTNRAKLRYSIGMSNGGAYSAGLSTIYKYKAGISYCAPSNAAIIQSTTTPFQYCMARYDNNPEVGATGNTAALTIFNYLNAKGLCSKYFIKERCPIYSERFARRGDISTAQSIAIFNELKARGYIDSKNYYVGFSDALLSAYQSNPTSFPALNSINPFLQAFVVHQIDLSVSDHTMYSDFNRASLKFLNTQCQ